MSRFVFASKTPASTAVIWISVRSWTCFAHTLARSPAACREDCAHAVLEVAVIRDPVGAFAC